MKTPPAEDGERRNAGQNQALEFEEWSINTQKGPALAITVIAGVEKAPEINGEVCQGGTLWALRVILILNIAILSVKIVLRAQSPTGVYGLKKIAKNS